MKSFQPHAESSRSLVELTTKFNSPVTNRLLAYWEALRGDQVLPRLSDFELMDLYDIASTMIIRDVVDGGEEFYCRYWGTELVQFFGFDASGKLVKDCYAPASAKVLKTRMMTAMQQETPLRVAGFVDLIDTVVPRSYEAIWVGIGNDKGEPAHAMAAFDIEYELTPEDQARHREAREVDAIIYVEP